MNLRDTWAGTVLIASIVAAGAWYAKCPEAVHRVFPQLQPGSDVEKRSSMTYIRKVFWSPDGRKVLSLARGEVGLDGPLVLHDLDDSQDRLPIQMPGESVGTMALAPDGRHMLVATRTGRLWWIGLQSAERSLLVELPAGVGFTAVALSADGKLAAAAGSDASIHLCDPDRASPAILDSGLSSRISEMRFSNDGCRFVSAGQNGWLSVWDLRSGKIFRSWKGHDQPVMAAAFLSDDRLISASLDDTIRIWDISTGHEFWRGEFGLYGVNTLAVSADGRTAAWGGNQRRIVVWDLENARKQYEIPFPASIIWDMQFSPDNNSLAVAGSDGKLCVYDAQTGAEVAGFDVGQRL